ncbi:class I SAM-dependent methyltransferase [Hymenobacter latericus]|uniref:class I SAM-dependent methyltransferase n=1 Tax=Hymenobacter sp. YIM 151858-1 TaxID=2987688 RepID=UPI0022278B9E|nr:class I SAM-dependent methyltransferase [Hymenobacter sp. YIM 151858-1]UYZ57457.1 class I SAM-dependent methyltransferase [Hymenobacter sp. YIM 151858-1]
MNSTVVSPLTGKGNVDFIKRYHVKDIVEAWRDQLQIDISSEFSGVDIDSFGLYRCNDTDLLFFDPKFEGSEYIYKSLHDGFEWYYVEDKWEYDIAISEIEKDKYCLEIGCGSGAFIKKAIQKGINIVGLETNSDAVFKAQKAGLPIYLGSVEDAIVKLNNRPDYVLAFQVLEHIAEPYEFIKMMIDSLAPKGRLVICVPNADSFYKYDNNVLDMPPHHQTRWSYSVFKKLESIFPVKLISAKYEPLNHWHTESWFNANKNYFRVNKWYGKLLFNRITIPVIHKFLQSKWRQKIKGHTIYVTFEKI